AARGGYRHVQRARGHPHHPVRAPAIWNLRSRPARARWPAGSGDVLLPDPCQRPDHHRHRPDLGRRLDQWRQLRRDHADRPYPRPRHLPHRGSARRLPGARRAALRDPHRRPAAKDGAPRLHDAERVAGLGGAVLHCTEPIRVNARLHNAWPEPMSLFQPRFPLRVPGVVLLALLLGSSAVFSQDAALQQAIAAYEGAEYDDAIDRFAVLVADASTERAVKKEALQYLGRAYVAKRAYDDARATIDRLLDLEPPLVELDPEDEPP